MIAGEAAPPIEKFAAQELRRYIQILFPSNPEVASIRFLVGSPQTNPQVARALAKTPFPATAEGYCILPLRFEGQRTVIVGGGSPRATLWAAYDLVDQWGVRYLLHGDVLPAQPKFQLPSASVYREPVLPIRQWRVVTELAFGMSSWGIEDYRPFLDQLAKLRFNRLSLSLWTHQPFLSFRYGGITRHSSTMFFGFRFPLSSDLPGLSAFRKPATEFENPDIPFSLDEEARLAAGVSHIRNIIDYGLQRGMDSVVSASISDFPREFAPLLKDWQVIRQAGEVTIVPGAKLDPDDPELEGLSRAIILATLNTYPQASRLLLSVPEHRQATDYYRRAWEQLDRKYRLHEVASLESLLQRASNRPGYHGGPARAQAEVQGDLIKLSVYDRLLDDGDLVRQSANPAVKFVFSSFAEELAPLLPRVLPPNSELLNFIDYTPTRVLQRTQSLKAVPAKLLPSTLILTLHDDNVGPLPQLATSSLAQLVRVLLNDGWKGFSTRNWLVGDHDAAAWYLSQVAWEPDVTVMDVHSEFLRTICGPDCVAEGLAGLEALERATVKLEQHGLGFAFPVPGMLMKHWSDKPLAPELLAVRADYLAARQALTRAATKASRDSRDLRYLQGRLDFGGSYISVVEDLHKGAAAEAAGDRKAALQLAEHAIATLRTAIESYAAVAYDQSDRGAIASINEFGFRPLRQKVNELRDSK